MQNNEDKRRKIIFLALFLICLTVIYGLFIHDLLAVSWQRFVDFFFYFVLMGSIFVLVRFIYLWRFKYLDLTQEKLKNMSHSEFVELIAQLCRKMGYKKVKVISGSLFDISYESNGKKEVIFCYHQKKITTTPIIENARVIFITDYVLEPYELNQLAGSHWKLIQHDDLIELLDKYLV
jgi:hypothetical protein